MLQVMSWSGVAQPKSILRTEVPVLRTLPNIVWPSTPFGCSVASIINIPVIFSISISTVKAPES